MRAGPTVRVDEGSTWGAPTFATQSNATDRCRKMEATAFNYMPTGDPVNFNG